MLSPADLVINNVCVTLQEQDYQNARLKARLTEVCTGGNETRSTLERKLGYVKLLSCKGAITLDSFKCYTKKIDSTDIFMLP